MGAWRRLGINRASFGAQTFDNRELKLLGRTHDAADICQTFELLRQAGFGNINFDLIGAINNVVIRKYVPVLRNNDSGAKRFPSSFNGRLLHSAVTEELLKERIIHERILLWLTHSHRRMNSHHRGSHFAYNISIRRNRQP